MAGIGCGFDLDYVFACERVLHLEFGEYSA